MSLIREGGYVGAAVQVFAPSIRVSTNNQSVVHGNCVRFSANGRYEFNTDGIKVPFSAGMTMGIPAGVTNLKIYDSATGGTLTSQIIEIM